MRAVFGGDVIVMPRLKTGFGGVRKLNGHCGQNPPLHPHSDMSSAVLVAYIHVSLRSFPRNRHAVNNPQSAHKGTDGREEVHNPAQSCVFRCRVRTI